MPKIGENLILDVKAKKATLTSWMCQHKNDGIRTIMAAFATALEAIERHLQG